MLIFSKDTVLALIARMILTNPISSEILIFVTSHFATLAFLFCPLLSHCTCVSVLDVKPRSLYSLSLVLSLQFLSGLFLFRLILAFMLSCSHFWLSGIVYQFQYISAGMVGTVGKISAFQSQDPQFDPRLCRDLN